MVSTNGASSPRKRRTQAELAKIDTAIKDAVESEHPVTLRGVFYRVVSAGVIEKTEAAYGVIGDRLVKLRRSGEVPYEHIVDSSRVLSATGSYHGSSYSNVNRYLEDSIKYAAYSWSRDPWENQPDRVIFLSEKDALSSIISPVTSKYDVSLGVAKGYSSETLADRLARKLAKTSEDVQGIYVYQLGDHDPSGINAWNELGMRIYKMVADQNRDVVLKLHFERLAVTEDQIRAMSLLTRPTKKTDSRYKAFSQQNEITESVEVDAIPPTVLRELVRNAIRKHIDFDISQARLDRQKTEQEQIKELASRISFD